jgi:hypothetical protein
MGPPCGEHQRGQVANNEEHHVKLNPRRFGHAVTDRRGKVPLDDLGQEIQENRAGVNICGSHLAPEPALIKSRKVEFLHSVDSSVRVMVIIVTLL